MIFVSVYLPKPVKMNIHFPISLYPLELDVIFVTADLSPVHKKHLISILAALYSLD